MQVFKMFFKILRKNLSVVIVYFCIFSSLMLMFGVTLRKNEANYEGKKTNAHLVCEDTSEDAAKICEYLKTKMNIVSPKADTTIDDALFWGEIDIYVYLPNDFSTKLFTEEEEYITIKTTPDNLNAYALTSEITSFLNLIKTRVQNNLSTRDTVIEDSINLLKTTEKNTTVTITNKASVETLSTLLGYGFYVICAVVLSLCGVMMNAFKSINIKRRMEITSYSGKKINAFLILGNLCIGVLFSLAIFVLTLVFVGFDKVSHPGLLCLNLVWFGITMVLISYALVMTIPSSTVLAIVNVVLPLGGAFLCGIFVPQSLLGDGVLKIAHFLPQYYAVTFNSYICTTEIVDAGKVLLHLLPNLVFITISIACIAISYILNKKKEA